MELLGRMQGNPTQAMKSLAQIIVHRVATHLLADIGADTLKELLVQLRGARLFRRWLPACVRDLFAGRRLSLLECGVLEAFVVEGLRIRSKKRELSGDQDSSMHFSGILPPVLCAYTNASQQVAKLQLLAARKEFSQQGGSPRPGSQLPHSQSIVKHLAV